MRPLLSWIGILGAIAFRCVDPQAPLSSAQERCSPQASLQECDVCPEMVVCRRACFRMGSSKK